jgi:putative flippase GtrA
MKATLGRILRCLVVSAGTTALSATVLVLLAVIGHVPAGTANVVAVCCGIVPSYIFNRRFVWRRHDHHSVPREIVPFWALSLAGLAASTVAVARVASLTADWSRSMRAVALPAANLSVFGVLWLVQFVILDRVIFRDRETSAVVLVMPSARAHKKEQDHVDHRSAAAH